MKVARASRPVEVYHDDSVVYTLPVVMYVPKSPGKKGNRIAPI
jgi:hypothetical protein